LKREEYHTPGTLLKSIVDVRHPLGFGCPRELAVFSWGGPAFELTEGHSVVSYAGENLLLSGWLTGEDVIALKSVCAEIPVGSGYVDLIGIRPQFRAQSRGTFKLLFNPILKSAVRLN